jgi:radical SAM superfamily enzyme YgiQ (UPF0313 family)
MHYEGNIIRPPSEANSILLQVTVGCSRNKCTFCGTYRGERFKIKTDEIIMADIAFAAQYARRQRHAFLCDGENNRVHISFWESAMRLLFVEKGFDSRGYLWSLI